MGGEVGFLCFRGWFWLGEGGGVGQVWQGRCKYVPVSSMSAIHGGQGPAIPAPYRRYPLRVVYPCARFGVGWPSCAGLLSPCSSKDCERYFVESWTNTVSFSRVAKRSRRIQRVVVFCVGVEPLASLLLILPTTRCGWRQWGACAPLLLAASHPARQSNPASKNILPCACPAASSIMPDLI